VKLISYLRGVNNVTETLAEVQKYAAAHSGFLWSPQTCPAVTHGRMDLAGFAGSNRGGQGFAERDRMKVRSTGREPGCGLRCAVEEAKNIAVSGEN
jgi:hypothetical protein